jgi:hypothetical protein
VPLFGFRQLVALQIADLVEVADGLRVVIRRSKTNQEGQGQKIAVPRGYRIRPVEHVQAWWLAAAEISSGRVFRSPALGGRVSTEPLANCSPTPRRSPGSTSASQETFCGTAPPPPQDSAGR